LGDVPWRGLQDSEAVEREGRAADRPDGIRQKALQERNEKEKQSSNF
jgi:hypothetical protein